MKKILPYIFLFLIFVNLFAPFSVGEENLSIVKNTAEAGNCKFVSAALNPVSGAGNHIASLTGKQVTLTIKTSNCLNEFLTGQLVETDQVSDNPVLNFDPLKITAPDGTVTLTFLAGEDHCESGSCEITYRLGLSDTKTTILNPNKILDVGDGVFADFIDSTKNPASELDFLCANNPCKQGNTWVMNGATGISQTYIFTYDTPVVAKDAITISGTGPQDFNITPDDTVTIGLYDSTMTAIPLSGGDPNPKTYNVLKDLSTDGGKTMKYSRYISGLTPATTYIVTIEPNFTTTDSFDGQFTQSLNKKITLQVTTLDKDGNIVTPPPQGGSNSTLNENQNQGDVLPPCSFTEIVGCVAVILYYLLFVPTSFLFALTGNFFDWTFHYSVTDTSYRSGFVVEGWGIVRDICNMFFIFVLLYIAFATILGLHGVNAKDMIVNVIIIGVLINFSMFAAQVVIDASNILARVFYNSNTIFITKGANGQTSGGTVANGVTNKTAFVGPDGQLELSAALVNKVNPQNLIIHSTQVGIISDQGNATNSKSASSLSAGTFILITLLATAVNIVGMIVFLSVGLIFVARVIGLWFSMIFAPLAFFTYTVPSMKSIDMIGWEKWWSELLKMSFLAPIFIFFLYLVIKFLDTGFDLIHVTATADGIGFVMSIVVPFIFIMLLLMKAKDIAKEFSGKLGQSITGGIAAVGGLALGGAALGAAFAGRKVIGGTMAASSRGEMATQRYEAAKAHKDATGDDSMLKNLSWHQKARGAVGSKLGLGVIYGKTDGSYDIKTQKKNMEIKSGLGELLNRKQKKVGDVEHGRHEWDEAKEKAGLKGRDDNTLSGVDKQKIETTFKKVKRPDAETEIRKQGYTDPHDPSKKVESEESFKAANRKDYVEAEKTRSGSTITSGANAGELTDEAKKKVEHDLNVDYNKELKAIVEVKLSNDLTHVKEASARKLSPVDRAIAKSHTGSYDVRDLSKTKADKREGVLHRSTAGLIAGIAMGVRTGLKGAFNVNHGVGQGEFLKDLSHTVSEAMKSAKVNVKVDAGHGGGSGGGDHGGGGHGGGGGHH